MHHHHLIRTLWALDLNGFADKLESIGRLWVDLVAGCSALMAMLPNAQTLDKHPRLKAIYIHIRRTIAIFALDTEGAVFRLFRRSKPGIVSNLSAGYEPRLHTDQRVYLAIITIVCLGFTLIAAHFLH